MRVCAFLCFFLAVFTASACNNVNPLTESQDIFDQLNCDHDWEYGLETPATCNAEGHGSRRCLECQETEAFRIPIDPDAHDWEYDFDATPPTCEGIGSGKRDCCICGITENSGMYPALGHVPGNWAQTTPPTCTATGIETGTCTRGGCNHPNTPRNGAAALGHAFGNNWGLQTAATAEDDGEESNPCTRGGGCTHFETRTAWATGTAGLDFEIIAGGGNGTGAYRVRAGTVTSGVVHIPRFHRSSASAPYLPVTEVGAANDSISQGAFRNANITGVNFLAPSNITSIGQNAFNGCTALANVTIPAGVTSIGNNAFRDCTALPGVTIPDSVTSIGDNAFRNCTGLTSVAIPAGVTSIGSFAFLGCISLESITVDAANPNFASHDGILYNKAMTQLIQVPGGITGSLTIPDSVTSIGESTFLGFTGLTSMTMGNNVTSIGQNAFRDCTGLTSVTIYAATPPTLSANVFFNTSVNLRILVPANSVAAYKAADGWSTQTRAAGDFIRDRIEAITP
jgi:hypothetical protein